LRRQLGHLVISRRLDASLQGPTMAVVTGRLILDQAAVVAAALGRLRGRTDAEAIHTSRIAVKRLRYLVEPLAADVADAAVPLAPLVRLQDALGALHDMQVLDRELGAAIAALPATDPRFAGLVALGERLDGQRRDALAAVRREWLDGCAERLELVTDAGHALVGLGSSQRRSRHLRPLSRSV
jgi:CHAD domain-containing protein